MVESQKINQSDEKVTMTSHRANQLIEFRRFVYAFYFAMAILIAFLLSKAERFVWEKLSLWKPILGEPRDEIIIFLAAILGGGTALYLWHRVEIRSMTEEMVSELSKVTWPKRQQVVNNTIVVAVTTIFATVFFALMDRFWSSMTDLVYGA